MGKFFEELAKKLAERWVSLLVLPGALFVLLAVLGARLGHRHALDRARLERAAAELAAAVGKQPAGTQVVWLVGFLVAATAAGLVAQAAAGATRRVWLGRWPVAALSRWRVRRRRARWHRRLAHRRELEQAHPAGARAPERQREVDLAAERVNRIALAEPGRPTWMGDRVHGVELVALNRYGLDLAFGWPRLWLVLPDTARAELTAAQAAFAGAVAVGTWAWPYLVLGALWWPAAVIGVGVGITGWARARAATDDLAALSEAVVDLHGRTLALSLGVGDADATGPLTVAEGERITGLVRKGR